MELIIEKWAFRIGADLNLWPKAYDSRLLVENNPNYLMLIKHLKRCIDEMLDEYFKE